MLNKIIPFFCLLALNALPLAAQQAEQYDIFQLRFLYNDVKFSDVISRGRQLLKAGLPQTAENLLEIHKYMALSFYNLGRQDSSRAHFYSLLSIDPQYEPDPVHTSPKILSFFNEIKASFGRDRQQTVAVPFKHYIFVEDMRSQAAARSFLLPGWGQLYKNQENKAWILGGAFLSSALTTVITYQLEKELRDKYRGETDPTKVTGRYNDYNSMSKTRRFFMYAAVSVWGLSLADAIFSDYTPDIIVNDKFSGLSLKVNF